MYCVRLVLTASGLGCHCLVHSITDESSPCPQSDNTGAVVGGVVALVAVIAVTVVMVTYLVLRYKRAEKM